LTNDKKKVAVLITAYQLVAKLPLFMFGASRRVEDQHVGCQISLWVQYCKRDKVYFTTLL